MSAAATLANSSGLLVERERDSDGANWKASRSIGRRDQQPRPFFSVHSENKEYVYLDLLNGLYQMND